MPAATTDILVPVRESDTLRNTVAHVVREARDLREKSQTKPTVHFVYPVRWRPIQGVGVVPGDSEALFDRIRLWAAEDLDSEDQPATDLPVTIVTERIGQDRYLFSPADYTSVIYEYAKANDIDRVVLDPEYSPGGSAPLMPPLIAGLKRADLTVEEAPVERVTRRSPIRGSPSIPKAGLIFGLSFMFYLLLGGTVDPFNVATGMLVAGLSTAIFTGITLGKQPFFSTLGMRFGRLLVYFPYLLWEIARANVTVAYIILHPDLPIDPAMRRFQAAVWGDYSVTTLANSITLTPGTLTVDVRRDSFYIHTLTQDARDGLNDGALERAVRFVFFGRKAMRIPSPDERGSVFSPETVETRRGLRAEIAEFTGQETPSIPERSARRDQE